MGAVNLGERIINLGHIERNEADTVPSAPRWFLS